MGAPLVVERSGGIIPKLRERNLAGCEKLYWHARTDGLRLWHNSRTLPQDSRARLAGRTRWVRVRGVQNFGSRISRTSRASRGAVSCVNPCIHEISLTE